MSVLTQSVDGLAAVSLAELVDQAALLDRVDRKYLLDAPTLERLLEGLADDVAVLDIDGRRRFHYRSVYFDTPELTSFGLAARARPQRWKVRTRTYCDGGEQWLEIKRRDRRGRTVKDRWRRHGAERSLSAQERRQVDRALDAVGGDRIGDRLVPTVTTSYERITVIAGRDRATIDLGVHCAGAGRPAADFGRHAIVETKSAGGPGRTDRLLWALGQRPLRLSKYASGVVAGHPGQPANRWARTLRRVGVVPFHPTLGGR